MQLIYLIAESPVDKKKLSGVLETDKHYPSVIYDQYVKAYSKGVFDFIKEDNESTTGEVIPRRYFSGGIIASAIKQKLELADSQEPIQLDELLGPTHKCYVVKVVLDPICGSRTDPTGGESDGGSFGGIDFTQVQTELSNHGSTFQFTLNDEVVKKIFSDEFAGFTPRIKEIRLLHSIDELIDDEGS